ncbi:hypothetical protein ILUMI_16678 [Ignelater luminosus]|uniref:DDE-1 domain-containing protein n=1 Tax=Ignelater luminosus TaxID=2038154 RepID=A0A8K0CTW3_IGNLU|nr:hypothetical protein ILUMI_16678 [Ignelater luminosus]
MKSITQGNSQERQQQHQISANSRSTVCAFQTKRQRITKVSSDKEASYRRLYFEILDRGKGVSVTMTKFKGRSTNRGGWSEENMNKAIQDVLDRKCSERAAADRYQHVHAQDNHIHMLSTPPHTTHRLQPLDRVFFKPFKQAYGSASPSWMRQNPGAQLTDYDIAGPANIPFTKATRLEIAQNGFR